MAGIADDEAGQPLSSGGFFVIKKSILNIPLDIRIPASLSESDVTAAVERTIYDTGNTKKIASGLKPSLLMHQKLAFNIRGVGKNLTSREQIQNTNLDGGHQFFFLLDRDTDTIYSINNTLASEDEEANMRFFKTQLDLFLNSIGDTRDYQLRVVSQKSRQPIGGETLGQVCNVSQFCSYAAVLSGIPVEELEETMPTKASTLFYLLQYAVNLPDIESKQAILNMLNNLVNQMTALQENEVNDLAPVHDVEEPVVRVEQERNPSPIFSWILYVLAATFDCAVFILIAISTALIDITPRILTSTARFMGSFFLAAGDEGDSIGRSSEYVPR